MKVVPMQEVHILRVYQHQQKTQSIFFFFFFSSFVSPHFLSSYLIIIRYYGSIQSPTEFGSGGGSYGNGGGVVYINSLFITLNGNIMAEGQSGMINIELHKIIIYK